jgi:hypothetical protein
LPNTLLQCIAGQLLASLACRSHLHCHASSRHSFLAAAAARRTFCLGPLLLLLLLLLR